MRGRDYDGRSASKSSAASLSIAQRFRICDKAPGDISKKLTNKTKKNEKQAQEGAHGHLPHPEPLKAGIRRGISTHNLPTEGMRRYSLVTAKSPPSTGRAAGHAPSPPCALRTTCVAVKDERVLPTRVPRLVRLEPARAYSNKAHFFCRLLQMTNRCTDVPDTDQLWRYPTCTCIRW